MKTARFVGLIMLLPFFVRLLPKFASGPSRLRRLAWWYRFLRDSNKMQRHGLEKRWGRGAVELAQKLRTAVQTSNFNVMLDILTNSFIMPESVAKTEKHKWGDIPDQEIHGI